jgi:LTXXQ motif family protein
VNRLLLALTGHLVAFRPFERLEMIQGGLRKWKDFCAWEEIDLVAFDDGRAMARTPQANGRSVMRSASLILLAILAFATTPARAQGTWLETRINKAICSSELTPVANTDPLARRLNLTDSQKAALKDMIGASASADASAKKSLCADKPDLSTAPGRMAFAQKMAEIRLAGLKAVEPKLQAFYDSLDAKQKKAFDTGGRIGGIFDWWGKK